MNIPLDKLQNFAYNTNQTENDEEKDFDGLSDEELCAICRLKVCGDTSSERSPADILAERYIQLVRRMVRPYYLVGGDHDDLLQEGMLGLLKAIREYTPGRSSFSTFASYCIRSRIYDAIRQAQTKNHQILSTAVSLEFFSEEKDETQEYPLFGGSDDPETLMIHREEQRQTAAELNAILSGFEKSVLSLYLEGFSFSEMARRLNRPVKSIDNAVTRIRRKLSPRLR